MTWWIWILAGLALLVVEVLIPGGILMVFFGVSALIVGALVALGLGGPLWLQLLVFTVLSVVSLLTLRGPVLKRMHAGPEVSDSIDSLVGAEAESLVDFAPGEPGQVELRGTAWKAFNGGDRTLRRGERCVVERVESLILFVRERSDS